MYLSIIPHAPRFDDDHLDEDDHRGCQLLMAAIVLVCVSAFLSWREIVYLCRGQLTDAIVTDEYEDSDDFGNTTTTVQFEFTDPVTGQLRRHSDNLPDSEVSHTGTLRVEFVADTETYARVAGNTQRWSLWVFGGSLVAAIIYVVKLAREANTPIRRNRRDRWDEPD